MNNRSDVSQRQIGRHYHVHQSTVSCNLRKRTSIHIRKRQTPSKMDSKDQEKRAKRNCGKLDRKLLRSCDLLLDDAHSLAIMSVAIGCFTRLIHLQCLLK